MAKDGTIKIRMLTVGPVATNCYVVSKKPDVCVVIDPGSNGKGIADFLRNEGLKPEAILLTHGHFDHFEGVLELTAEMGGTVYILDEEKELIADPSQNGSLGLMGHGTAMEPEKTVHDGDVITAAGIRFEVIHTPGHTRGGCCYYIREEGVLFAGDTIFMESIGRTDLPTGNMREILASIREKILTLPDDTRIMPGHGPTTDVAYETANNPYA